MKSINPSALDRFYRDSPWSKRGFIMRLGKKGWTVNLGYGATTHPDMKEAFYKNIEMCISVLDEMDNEGKREEWIKEWNRRKLKLELLKQEI
jgi:hypothetical protein